MAALTFITTCRGRLAHLKQSLPTFVAQPGTACVVVDYDCPDNAGDWVTQNFPKAGVVRVTGKPRFEIAAARNLGVEHARDIANEWLCFVDADSVLKPNFAQEVLPLLERGHFYRPLGGSTDSAGICIVHAEDFHRVGGYDDVLQGWGMEDRDLYMRLGMAGVRPATFPHSLVEVIPHGDSLRVRFYEHKDGQHSSALNQLYCNAKWDFTKLREPLSRETRQHLYELVSHEMAKAKEGKPVTIRLDLGSQKVLGRRQLKTVLVYHLTPIDAPE